MSCKSSLEDRQSEVEEIRDQMEERVGLEGELRMELESLRAEVSRLGGAEEALQSKLSSRDRKISHLEEKVTDLQESRIRRMDTVSP